MHIFLNLGRYKQSPTQVDQKNLYAFIDVNTCVDISFVFPHNEISLFQEISSVCMQSFVVV